MRYSARMRRLAVPLMAALVVGGLPSPPVAAQERGVFFKDPASPAGTEYAIPLERARGDGRRPKRDGDGGRAPRFGEGITPPSSGSGGTGGPQSGVAGSSSGSAGPGSDAGGASSSRTRKGKAAATAGPAGGSSDESGVLGVAAEQVAKTAAVGSSGGEISPGVGVSGMALGVLGVGLLLGLLLRRLRSEPGD